MSHHGALRELKKEPYCWRGSEQSAKANSYQVDSLLSYTLFVSQPQQENEKSVLAYLSHYQQRHCAQEISWKIKGSPSSSWMNSPIPSLLLPLWQNESLWKIIGIKICFTCTFIRMKIKSFSCETFSTSTRSKEANGNSEVEVKSARICICQAAHQASMYSSFCSMWLEVFLLPPGWDASPSQGYPQHFICQHLFIHLSRYWGTVRLMCRPGTQTTRNGKEIHEKYMRNKWATEYLLMTDWVVTG